MHPPNLNLDAPWLKKLYTSKICKCVACLGCLCCCWQCSSQLGFGGFCRNDTYSILNKSVWSALLRQGCDLLQCMAGRAEAQHSASPSLVDEPRRRPASLKDSLLRSPVEDPAGPDTQENAAHQKQGQVVHSECGNRSSDDDAAIHAHYPNQVRAVPANMCKHIPCTVCAPFGR